LTAKILIVEDEPVLASGIRRFLLLMGFQFVECAGSVKKALSMMDEADYDIAVLDLNLRGESAEPVAKALRQKGRPFVLMSGYDPSGCPAGLSDAPFFSKPVDPNKLAAVLRRMLEKSNAA
jgi:DNA-binding response OmpR family regulator